MTTDLHFGKFIVPVAVETEVGILTEGGAGWVSGAHG